jgi:hypothetical protein
MQLPNRRVDSKLNYLPNCSLSPVCHIGGIVVAHVDWGASVMKELDDKDLQDQNRREREAVRISQLQGAQKRAAETREQRAKANYIASRVRSIQFGNPDPA